MTNAATAPKAPTARAIAAESRKVATAAVKAASVREGRIDFEALAGGATVAESMPKTSRIGGTHNPFVPLLERSLAEGVPLVLPVIADDDLKTTLLAVRRAARIMGIGVSIRSISKDGGTTVTFQARDKK